MAKRTVKVKNHSDVNEELKAAAAITPGQLIELTTADTVQRHSTAEGNALKMFAVEDELQGKGITDDYAVDDQVSCWLPGRGDFVYALLADGEDVSIGTFLASNGDGDLRQHDITSGGAEFPEQIVAQAQEALDLSGSSGEEPTRRIIVRVV